jgi:hypothetical protein
MPRFESFYGAARWLRCTTDGRGGFVPSLSLVRVIGADQDSGLVVALPAVDSERGLWIRRDDGATEQSPSELLIDSSSLPVAVGDVLGARAGSGTAPTGGAPGDARLKCQPGEKPPRLQASFPAPSGVLDGKPSDSSSDGGPWRSVFGDSGKSVFEHV